MKGATTNLLFTVAAAIGSHCDAYVAVPPTATSSFGVKSYVPLAAIVRGKKKCSTIGTRRTSTCIYSVPYLPNDNEEEEGDDGSFFLSASQQASQDRYEMLKQGKDPLAISLSTYASVNEEPHHQQQQDTVAKEEVATVNGIPDSNGNDSNPDPASSPTIDKDDYDGLLSSLSELDTEQDTDVEESSISSTTTPSALDEIKRVKDEITQVKSQIKDSFQKRLLGARIAFDKVDRVGEGSTAEEMEAERNARLAAADEVAKILKSGEELEEEEKAAAAAVTTTASTSTADIGEGSTAEEMEEVRNARLAAADEVAKTLKTTVESTAVTCSTTSTASLEEEDNEETTTEPVLEIDPPSTATKNEQEQSNATQSLLSSDGKAIYEPSQSALHINQENVKNGLMLLTRSLLVLYSVVNRLDEDKK